MGKTMAKRNIVRIDEAKCNGCGQCVTACAEGAIAIIDGKARLVSEIYCDGLGACLGTCPMDAIKIEQREAAKFDEQATEQHLKKMKKSAAEPMPCGCPGALSMTLEPRTAAAAPAVAARAAPAQSQLSQWPVQLTLVSPTAPYLANSDLLLAADCVPFAMAGFHSELLAGRKLVVGCPKLDDAEPYVEKLAAIIKANDLNSLTVVHMQVPCCSGITWIARKAIEKAGVTLPFEDITISLHGEIMNRQIVG